MSEDSAGRTARPGEVVWLPRLQAIERCTETTCNYLAWLLILPDRSVLTAALGPHARNVSLWPSVEAALEAFGPGTVVDDSPVRHMTAEEAASALGVTGPEEPPHGSGGAQASVEDEESAGPCRPCGPGLCRARSGSTGTRRHGVGLIGQLDESTGGLADG